MNAAVVHALECIECEQRSPQWFEVRRGIITMSEAGTIQAKGRGGGDSKTRATYMYKLIGEILSGESVDGYTNEHMERGREMEQEACDYYAFRNGVQLMQVGFLRWGPYGCSPDRLVGSDGILGVKTRLPHILAELHATGKISARDVAQAQGELWISGRKWFDYLAYWPTMPPYLERLERDDEYIEQLADACRVFSGELNTVLAGIRERTRNGPR